jgi:hypothetical protein
MFSVVIPVLLVSLQTIIFVFNIFKCWTICNFVSLAICLDILFYCLFLSSNKRFQHLEKSFVSSRNNNASVVLSIFAPRSCALLSSASSNFVIVSLTPLLVCILSSHTYELLLTPQHTCERLPCQLLRCS